MKKQILLIIPISLGLMISSCKKDETKTSPDTPSTPINVTTNIVGTWTEAQHLINGSNTAIGKTISFSSNGTYTSQFTYPWHCQPCSNSNDSGIWSYSNSDSLITLTSTKNQTEFCPSLGMDATHDNQIQSMKIMSYASNEFIVKFSDVNCSQDVEITFHR